MEHKERDIKIYEKKIISYLLNNFNEYKSYNDELKNHNFLDKKYKNIFDALENYYVNNIVEISTLVFELSSILTLRIQGNIVSLLEAKEEDKWMKWDHEEWEDYLNELIAQTPLKKEFELACNEVTEYTTLINMRKQIMDDVSSSTNLATLHERTKLTTEQFDNAIQHRKEIETIGDHFDRHYAEFSTTKDSAGIIYLPKEYDELNNLFKGFKPGSLITIGARPGVGKTMIALDWAHKIAAINKKHCLFFSLEMQINELIGRIAKNKLHLDIINKDYARSNTEHYQKQLQKLRVYLSDIPLVIEDNNNTGIDEIIERIKKVHKRKDTQIIFIDYLQLIHTADISNNTPEVAILSNYTRRLKKLAGELQVPIVMLSQFNRGANLKEGKEPKLFDLRGSGSIEQDSDIVILLHKNEDIEEQGMVPGKELNQKLIFLVEKNRNGQVGKIELNVSYEYGSINK